MERDAADCRASDGQTGSQYQLTLSGVAVEKLTHRKMVGKTLQ
jgi:hypothetical protein